MLNSTIDAIADARTILRKQVRLTSYGQVAAELEVSKGALWKFLNKPGYIPKDPGLRKRLGLPSLMGVSPRRED
jgi:hypothetical protein